MLVRSGCQKRPVSRGKNYDIVRNAAEREDAKGLSAYRLKQ